LKFFSLKECPFWPYPPYYLDIFGKSSFFIRCQIVVLCFSIICTSLIGLFNSFFNVRISIRGSYNACCWNSNTRALV